MTTPTRFSDYLVPVIRYIKLGLNGLPCCLSCWHQDVLANSLSCCNQPILASQLNLISYYTTYNLLPGEVISLYFKFLSILLIALLALSPDLALRFYQTKDSPVADILSGYHRLRRLCYYPVGFNLFSIFYIVIVKFSASFSKITVSISVTSM